MNIVGLTTEELWKLAYEQEEQKYKALMQILLLNDNIKTIIEEINRKEIAKLNVS